MKAILVLSGGMDSATLAYHLKGRGYGLHCVSFDYGQRHKRELQSAAAIAKRLNAQHTILDISAAQPMLKGSALTDNAVDVPHGHYAAENMKLTVVPNRNAIMLSIAWGVAVAEGADLVATAVHAGDHAIYPDCRADFIQALSLALRIGTEDHRTDNLRLYAPYLFMDKGEIAAEGHTLGVPYELTWTCYEGGAEHCGKCGACVERREAFLSQGIPDPTQYVDTESVIT